MLEQKLNEFPVVYRIQGHSAINGGTIPEGSTIDVTSNDETVATVVSSVTVPPGGTQMIDLAVQQLAPGSTDISHKVTAPDGSIYEGGDTLVLLPVEPGLIRVSGELIQVQPNP